MSFVDSYKSVFTVYRIFGLVPFNFHLHLLSTNPQSPSSNENRKFGFWFICLFSIELFILVYSSILWHRSYTNDNDSFNIFRWSMVVAIRICIIVITFESYRHQRTQLKILNQLHEIDRIFSEKLNLQINYHRLKRSIFVDFSKWISVCVIDVLILFAAVCFEETTIEDYVRLMAPLYPLFKKAMLGSVYVTYAILIKHRIQAVLQVLDSSLLLPHDSTFEIPIDRESLSEYEAFEFRRLIHLWQLFPRIYDTIQLINDTFKWSSSMNFFVNVFDICSSIFHYFGKSPEDSHQTYNVNIISYIECAFICYYVFCFGAIIQMANALTAEADKIAPKIHRLILGGIVSDDLQEFVSEFMGHSLSAAKL